MNSISTMLGFIGRKIKSLETEVGKINSTLDDVSPAPKVIPIERGGTGCTTVYDVKKTLDIETNVHSTLVARNDTNLSSEDKIIELVFPDLTDLDYPYHPDDNFAVTLDGTGGGRIRYTGVARVDLSMYLTTGFKADSLVTMKLYKNGNFTGMRFNIRPSRENPYIICTGTTLIDVNQGDVLSLRASVSSGGGTISKGMGSDTRMIVSMARKL